MPNKKDCPSNCTFGCDPEEWPEICRGSGYTRTPAYHHHIGSTGWRKVWKNFKNWVKSSK